MKFQSLCFVLLVSALTAHGASRQRRGLFDVVGNTVSAVTSTASNAVKGVTNTVGSVASGVASGVSKTVSGVASGVKDTIANGPSKAIGAAADLTSAVTNVAAGATSAVTNTVSGVTSAVTDTISGTTKMVTDTVAGATSNIPIVGDVTAAVTGTISGVTDAVTGTVKNTVKSVADTTSSVATTANNAIKIEATFAKFLTGSASLLDLIKVVLEVLLQVLQSFLDKIGVSKFFDCVGTSVSAVGNSVGQLFQELFTTPANALTQLQNAVVGGISLPVTIIQCVNA